MVEIQRMRKYFSGTNLTPEEQQKPELQIARALVEARQIKHVTQQQLAERTGIAQADISRLENGNSNPTLRTLQRLADGLEMTVQVGFKDPQSAQDEEPEEETVVVEELEEGADDEENSAYGGSDDDDDYEYDDDDDDNYVFPFGGLFDDDEDDYDDEDDDDDDDIF